MPHPEPTTHPSPRLARLGVWADPEWFLFLCLLLIPALTTLALGDRLRASFFLGTAIAIATLKGLGALLLTPQAEGRPTFVRYPFEMFAGFAALCGWFYLRNLITRVWPNSYSLQELAWVFPLLLGLHLAGAILRLRVMIWPGWGSLFRAIGARVLVQAPFVAALTMALWSVAGTHSLLGIDPLHHAFTGRIYHDHGITFPVPPLNLPLTYPTGFGAMNAGLAALAPLDAVQTFHLQHVLWCVAAVFMLPCTVAWMTRRALPMLHLLALPFLAIFPLYSLYPDIFYPGTPKQVGPPLFVATALLPLVAPVTHRSAFVVFLALWALLPPLTVALNPACAAFAAAATLLGVVVCLARLRDATLLVRGGVLILTGVLLLATSGLIFIQDPYYQGFLARALPSRPTTAQTAAAAPGTPVLFQAVVKPAPPAPFFSPRRGAERALAANPFRLSPAISTTSVTQFDHLKEWTEKPIPRLHVALTLSLGALVLIAHFLGRMILSRQRSRRQKLPTLDLPPSILPPGLVTTLLVGMGSWFLVKYPGGFLGHGLSLEHLESHLLHAYTRYLMPRCELLVSFLILTASLAALYLAAEKRWGLGTRRARLCLVALSGLAAVFPLLSLATGAEWSGPVMIPVNARFPVTEGDLRLVEWIEENIPPERGHIGLAALATRGGLRDLEYHLVPLDAGHALALRCRRAAIRFALANLEGEAGVEGYRQHVAKELDVAWCLAQNVRFFYVGPQGLKENPGLARAIAEGRLQWVWIEGASGLYEVIDVR